MAMKTCPNCGDTRPEPWASSHTCPTSHSAGKGKALKARIIHSVKNLDSARKHKTGGIIKKLNQ